MAVLSYRPHKTVDKDFYLHYWAWHASPAIEAAAKKADQSEIDILNQAKNKIAEAKMAQKAILLNRYGTNDAQKLNDIEYLISGKYLENVKTIMQQPVSTTEPLDYESVIGIGPQALLDDAQNAILKSEEFQQQLQELADEILSTLNTDVTFEQYEELMQDYFLGNKGKYNGPKMTNVQATILNALLAREGQALFSRTEAQYKGNFSKLTGDQTKILASISLLKDPSNLTSYIKEISNSDAGLIVRHGDGSESVSQNVLEYITEWFNKILKWKDQGAAIAAEGASAAGALSALQAAVKAFQDNDLKVQQAAKGTDTLSIQTDFSGTKAFFDLVTQQMSKGNAFKNASTRRTAKSDNILEVYFNEDGGKVSLYQGLTVKNYRTFSLTNKGETANIQIQSGTPLLTLLTREAGFSDIDLYNLIQVGTAFGTEEGYDIGLTLIWNQVMQNAKYLALLDTLAGFTNEQDRAFYMVFNGKIYDIIDILAHIQNMNIQNAVSWGIIGGDTGLERINYLAMNKWIDPEDKMNPISAEERSGTLMMNVTKKMYDTKIRVNLHIAQLSILASLN